MLRLLACLLVALAAAEASCDFNNPASLRKCVKSVLESSRPALRSKFNKIRIPDVSGSRGIVSWQVTSIYVRGAAEIQIGSLWVSRTGSKLHVHFTVHWPKLYATMNAVGRACKRILWKKRCVKIRGSPRITLKGPSAGLHTDLKLSLSGGKIKITPRNTKISINLGKVNFEPRLKGLAGLIFRVVGKPARNLANFLANYFWKRSKKRIQDKLSKELDTLITKELARRLPNLLTGFSG